MNVKPYMEPVAGDLVALIYPRGNMDPAPVFILALTDGYREKVMGMEEDWDIRFSGLDMENREVKNIQLSIHDHTNFADQPGWFVVAEDDL